MTFPLRVHAASHIGHVHTTNEDSWSVGPPDEGGLLLAVCDGMGGMGRGDEASKLAVAEIRASMATSRGLPPERMRQAIRVADEKVREQLCSGPMGNPGSTAVLVYVTDGAAHVCWAGDSRAYLIRDHRVVERTRDHKLVEELVAAGQMSAEDARNSNLAHVVTRALGGRGPEEPAVKPATLGHPWKLAHGDVLLLCSDGLSDLVDDEELPNLVDEMAPDRATELLVEKALERGGHDNITCIVARWEGATYKEDDVSTPVMQSDRTSIPDLRSWSRESLDAGLERGDESRVTEEIDRDEAAAIMEDQGRDSDTDEVSEEGTAPPKLTPAPLPVVEGPVAPPPDPSANDPEPPATPPIVWIAAAIGGLLGLLGAAGWLLYH